MSQEGYDNCQEVIAIFEEGIDILNSALYTFRQKNAQMEIELIQYRDKTRIVIANLRTILTGGSDIETLVSDSIRLLENIDA